MVHVPDDRWFNQIVAVVVAVVTFISRDRTPLLSVIIVVDFIQSFKSSCRPTDTLTPLLLVPYSTFDFPSHCGIPLPDANECATSAAIPLLQQCLRWGFRTECEYRILRRWPECTAEQSPTISRTVQTCSGFYSRRSSRKVRIVKGVCVCWTPEYSQWDQGTFNGPWGL